MNKSQVIKDEEQGVEGIKSLRHKFYNLIAHYIERLDHTLTFQEI